MNRNINGFSIPFRLNTASGGVVAESGGEKLKENIVHILMTRVGERVMRRDYGGGLRELLHDPNNDALRAIVQHQIAKSIGQWEPRVELRQVSVTQQDGTLMADIHYLIRESQQSERVSVPLGLGGI